MIEILKEHFWACWWLAIILGLSTLRAIVYIIAIFRGYDLKESQ